VPGLFTIRVYKIPVPYTGLRHYTVATSIPPTRWR